jgi:hypothetical protein
MEEGFARPLGGRPNVTVGFGCRRVFNSLTVVVAYRISATTFFDLRKKLFLRHCLSPQPAKGNANLAELSGNNTPVHFYFYEAHRID